MKSERRQPTGGRVGKYSDRCPEERQQSRDPDLRAGQFPDWAPAAHWPDARSMGRTRRPLDMRTGTTRTSLPSQATARAPRLRCVRGEAKAAMLDHLSPAETSIGHPALLEQAPDLRSKIRLGRPTRIADRLTHASEKAGRSPSDLRNGDASNPAIPASAWRPQRLRYRRESFPSWRGRCRTASIASVGR